MNTEKMLYLLSKMPVAIALCMLLSFAALNVTGCGGTTQPIDQGEYTPVEEELDEDSEREMSRQLERES